MKKKNLNKKPKFTFVDRKDLESINGGYVYQPSRPSIIRSVFRSPKRASW